ncbi:MAG: tetratricopeptide repeat protein [Rikenellaceae bacterium]
MKKLLLSVMAMVAVATASAGVQETFDAAVAAYSAKDYAAAAAGLESVINEGMDDESVASQVATAKTYLPKCYFQLGGKSFMAKDYPAARESFTKSAEYAELYDDVTTMTKAQMYVGKTYEVQGGELFNNKDYAAALPIFESGYASDPRNAKMANWLGTCYCETGEFEKGMEVFGKVVAVGTANPKYAAEAEDAEKNMVIYTNNKVADLQANNDYDGVIAMADALLATNPSNGVAAKVRLQAYMNKKDYNTVVSSAEETAALQTSDEEKSNVYFILGAAYNAKEMKDQAIASFKKVTAGPNAETAAATIAELTKE